MTSTRFSSGSVGAGGVTAASGVAAAGAGAGGAAGAGAGAPDVLAGSALAGGKRRAKGAKGAGGNAGGAGPRAPQAPRKGKARGAGGRTSSLAGHDFAVVMKQLVPFALVALVLFAVAMPVSTAAIPDTSVFNLDYTHDQMKFRFWDDELSLAVVLGAAAFGLVLGVRAFRFLLVKCESTAVLSLPLSRQTLFATRFCACLVALAVGIGVPLAASLVVNIVALDVWAGVFEQFAYVFCGLFLTAAVACAVAAIACAVSGTLAEAVAFSAALLSGVSVAAWGLNALMDHLLVGSAFGAHLTNAVATVAPSLLDAVAPVNPLLFFAQEAAAHQVFIVQHPTYYPVAGNWLLLGAWLVALVALALAACALLRRRRGERAGIAGLNVTLSLVVGMVVGLAAFGLTFTLLAGLNVVAAVVGSYAVFWAVSAVLLKGPLKGRASTRRTLGVVGAETAALACVLVVLITGGFGYAQAVPETNDVESVGVSYTGSPSYLAAPFNTATAGDGAYYYNVEYTFTDAEAIDIVRGVHERLTATGGQELGANRADFGESVMPYDVVVRYTLADGSELVRYYDRATLSELAALAELDGTAHARELARAAVSGDTSLLSDEDAQALASSTARQAYTVGDIYVSDRLYANPMLVNCDAQARTELLAALAEDVAAQSVQDRYYPAGTCRGVLMFTQAGEAAAETFSYNIENTVVYLTDEFTHTLAWFAEKGLSEYLAVSDEASLVESITVQRYAPFEGMNEVTEPQSALFMGYRADVDQQFISMQDFGTKYSTEEAAQIDELLSLARNTGYLNNGAYLLSVKLAGVEAYSYLMIPADAAPEWLVRVAG